MTSRKISGLLGFGLLLVAAGALAAPSPYCMGDICVGDSLAKHRERFKIDQGDIATMKKPACDIMRPHSYSHVDGTTEFKITVWPNPAKSDLDNGEYYEVTGIQVLTPPAGDAAVLGKLRELGGRFQMKATRNSTTWQSADGKVLLIGLPDAARIPAASSFEVKKTPWSSQQYAQQKGCGAALTKF